MRFNILFFVIILMGGITISAQSPIPFDHKPLHTEADLSELMVDGISRFLDNKSKQTKLARESSNAFDFESALAFNKSVTGLRSLLAARCGVVDPRSSSVLQITTSVDKAPLIMTTGDAKVLAVSWEVLEGFEASGVLIQPLGEIRARVILLPDADMTPEQVIGMSESSSNFSQAISTLVSGGIEILAIQMVNRTDTYSGNSRIGKYTNQPHREWIYRQAYEVGRHIIGYELQTIFSVLDLYASSNLTNNHLPIGVIGHGEGGLLALYAAALDTRINSTLVSGYFDQRATLWQEPIYRNVFGLLQNFGDAELAAMCWPRNLVIEPGEVDLVSGPPKIGKSRTGAAPGVIRTPEYLTAEKEVMRAKSFLPDNADHIRWIGNTKKVSIPAFSEPAIQSFLDAMDLSPAEPIELPLLVDSTKWINPSSRQKKILKGMERHVQRTLQLCEKTRDSNFWEPLMANTSSVEGTKSEFRKILANQLGALPFPDLPFNTKARILKETASWTRYEVSLDVWPGVFAWGILVVPKSILNNQKRGPVVVCQHGLEGLPMDMVTMDTTSAKYATYQGLATKLAERGYITFSPITLTAERITLEYYNAKQTLSGCPCFR